MSRLFAVIQNNKVVNTIVSNTIEDAQAAVGVNLTCIDYTDGWQYPEGIDGGVYFPIQEITN